MLQWPGPGRRRIGADLLAPVPPDNAQLQQTAEPSPKSDAKLPPRVAAAGRVSGQAVQQRPDSDWPLLANYLEDLFILLVEPGHRWRRRRFQCRDLRRGGWGDDHRQHALTTARAPCNASRVYWTVRSGAGQRCRDGPAPNWVAVNLMANARPASAWGRGFVVLARASVARMPWSCLCSALTRLS